MIKNLKFVLTLSISITALISCSDFNKLMKSDNHAEKKDGAIKYFNEKEYENAAALLEDVIPFYKLSIEGEKLYYYYCMSNYYTGDYYLASYYFRRFINQYPSSQYAEECQFLSAMCSVYNSPEYSLDQTETLNALDQLQIFIDMHPNSSLVDSSNQIMDRLNMKLETKQFESAKLYYQTENYKAAVTSFKLHLEDYPNSKFKEEALYLSVKSRYSLAINSIDSKKLERLHDTLKSYRKFVAEFPTSEYNKELKDLNRKAEKEIKLINT